VVESIRPLIPCPVTIILLLSMLLGISKHKVNSGHSIIYGLELANNKKKIHVTGIT
jgi:hypothetical protein